MKALKVEVGAPVEPVGEFSVRLDAKRCRTHAEFLREIGVVLQFPPYYGANWDAFEECVHDLEWLPDVRINLGVEHADQLLASESERELYILIDILKADTEWQRPLTIRLDSVSGGRIAEAFAGLLR